MGVDAKRLFGTWRRLRARLLIDQKGAGDRRSETTEKPPPAAIWSFRIEVACVLAEKCMWLVALKELFHDAVPHCIAQILFCERFPYRTPEERIAFCDAEAEPSKVN
jgi:hypothetical protein